MADHHAGRGAGDARHIVMLGHPVAVIAQPFRMAGKIQAAFQRQGRVAALDDGRKIEHRKWNGRQGNPLRNPLLLEVSGNVSHPQPFPLRTAGEPIMKAKFLIAVAALVLSAAPVLANTPSADPFGAMSSDQTAQPALNQNTNNGNADDAYVSP